MTEMERQEVSESVIDNDERVQVSPMTSPPYKWICNLQIESINGRFYVGSGFKIHILEVNRSVVVTSGHCTFVEGSYAAKITVIFPGENAIDVGPNDLYASPEYIQNKSEDHDYGLILLPGPGDCDEGFGWSTIIPNNELGNRLVTVCGFPADKPDNTMWISGRKIHSYTANRIYYQTDTFGGQSGSPVYTWYNGYWTVLGVHSYGVGRTVANSAPRFTVQMITRFLERMDCLNRKSLRSVHFPGVYIRCDGREVVSTQQPGVVNCQYRPPSLWESFFIIPVEMRPSSALEFVYTVALESALFRNVYIRLDGNGMNSTQTQGAGVVNCQASVGLAESFMTKVEWNGGYSFRNAQFPNCYIRMDGTGVTRQAASGGGVVNCQYYDSPFNVASLETFFVEEHQD